MRNDEIVEIMKAMEENFKIHSDGQLEKFTSLLEKHMATTEIRLSQLAPSPSDSPIGSTDAAATTRATGGVRPMVDVPPMDLHSILKTLRVDVPCFDGSNVDDWLYKINKFFTLHGVAPAMRLAVVAFHLDGEPSTWYQWMEKGGALTSWDTFLLELRKRFGTSVYDDPLGRISKLIQRGSVSQFRAEFEGLMTRITGVSEPLFLNFFIWGLK